MKVLTDRRSTIDDARRWLLAKGYSVSRNAVWNYRMLIRNNPAPSFAFVDDADARRRLSAWMKEIHGKDLFAVAYLAALLSGHAGITGDVRTPKK
jgi:hypothetical protein